MTLKDLNINYEFDTKNNKLSESEMKGNFQRPEFRKYQTKLNIQTSFRPDSKLSTTVIMINDL